MKGFLRLPNTSLASLNFKLMKNFKSNRWTMALLLACLLVTNKSEAKDLEYIRAYQPISLDLGGGVLIDTLYDPYGHERNGENIADEGDHVSELVSVQNRLVLFNIPHLERPNAMGFEFGLRFKFYFKKRNGRWDSTGYQRLYINYDPLARTTYRYKDSYKAPNSTYLILKIDSASGRSEDGAELDLGAMENLFAMHLNMNVSRIFKPEPTKKLSGFNVKGSINRGHLKIKWDAIHWAEKYELEWTFVDDYKYSLSSSGEIQGLRQNKTDLEFKFRNNSTRVIIDEPYYDLPLINESGYLLFRARAVGLWDAEAMQNIYAIWTGPSESGKLSTVNGPHIYKIARDEVHEGGQQKLEACRDLCFGWCETRCSRLHGWLLPKSSNC